jgi:hypothetical protein
MSTAMIDLLREFQREADLVGLWQIVPRIRQLFPEAAQEEIFNRSLSFIREMLLSGFEAGDPPYSAQGYRRWADRDIKSTVKRIEKEWRRLGHDPDIADIVWFRPPAMNN